MLRIIPFALAATLSAATFSSAAPQTTSIPTKAEAVCPMKIGATIPATTLQNVRGKEVDLRSIVAEKPTVLVFYRGDWCPYCNAQLGALGKLEPKLLKMGYQIVAISPDLPAELQKSLSKNKIKYRLLSDAKMQTAQKMGLAYRLDDATYKKYNEYGIDLEKSSGQKHHLLPVPAVYILNRKGTAQFSYVNPDYTVRLQPEVLLAAAKAGLTAK